MEIYQHKHMIYKYYFSMLQDFLFLILQNKVKILICFEIFINPIKV